MTTKVFITALIARMGSFLFPAFTVAALATGAELTGVAVLAMLSIAAWIVNGRMNAQFPVEPEESLYY